MRRSLMPLFRKSKHGKPTETRRRIGESQPPWRRFVASALSWPTLVAFLFWAAVSGIILSGNERPPYFLNQTLSQPVFSRVNFERVNEIRTAEQCRQAQQDIPDHFRINTALMDGIQSELRDLYSAVKAAQNYEEFSATPEARRWPLDRRAFAALDALGDDAGGEKYKKHVDKVVERLRRESMIQHAAMYRDMRSTSSHVMLDHGDGKFVPAAKESLTYAMNGAHVAALAESVVKGLFSPEIEPVLAGIVRRAIVPAEKDYHPVYVYDEGYTKQKIDECVATKPVMDSYKVGDNLVKRGVLDGEGLALLQSEQQQYLAQRNVDPDLRKQWRKQRAGILGILLAISTGLTIFTYRCQPRIVHKPLRALALAALLIGMLAVDRLVLGGIGASPIWSVATTTMTAAILTIAYAPAFAFGATTCLALMTSLTLESPFGMLIVLLIVAAVVVQLLREIRTRLKMVEVGGISAMAAAIGAALVGLTRQLDLMSLAKESALAALAALAGISIVLVLLPVIERIFRITTNLTLLEWADTSQPLLRQLIEKAPGTWQHSHLLGSMAEAAAEEIDANGLLARVGAYYHDIGKTCKPNYFVENQPSKVSAHKGLAPTMSLLVILAHVKDGLALARENRLPPAIQRFISEHHGTTLVRYFHAMATQEAKASGRRDRQISDTEFRYPGPKPKSRETAILMLCDGVEGTIRAIQEPTPGRIEGAVHDVLMDRLMDGQFDDCDITLKELARVEASLVKSLQAIHHGRISYPKVEESAEAQTA
jgi:putative nucleotidyltransferase with HDIG domain